MNKTWRKLIVNRADLQLSPTLGGGQSFRWNYEESGTWTGVFGNKVWLLSQKDDHLLYQMFDAESSKVASDAVAGNLGSCSDTKTENMLKSYFRLDVNLSHYYKLWSEADPYFREVAPRLYGVRILNQDVTENVFSFICSSNNRIERITSMVEKLCEFYGDPIAEVHKKTFKSFPTIERLAEETVESDLKKAGFGYRAKFVSQAACLIKKLGGAIWLENLKLLPYQDAKRHLMKLPGIGAKVADCICLMSLGHLEAIPVDTHVLQLAVKTYLPHLKKYKSLTNKVYNEIGDHFRSLHGSYAGWANTVLFCSHLKQFQELNEEKNEKASECATGKAGKLIIANRARKRQGQGEAQGKKDEIQRENERIVGEEEERYMKRLRVHMTGNKKKTIY